ncbi:MAG TPA: hypothetical protein PKC43_02795 [Phycisphaerales bacterium]|nr:hypothetical protein [Phycisphaerales bacterium]HMP36354.1 hypothetical protein [Phycisphaerales bacterium]
MSLDPAQRRRLEQLRHRIDSAIDGDGGDASEDQFGSAAAARDGAVRDRSIPGAGESSAFNVQRSRAGPRAEAIDASREILIDAEISAVWEFLSGATDGSRLFGFFGSRLETRWDGGAGGAGGDRAPGPGASAARAGRRLVIMQGGMFPATYFGRVEECRAPEVFRARLIVADRAGSVDRLIEYAERALDEVDAAESAGDGARAALDATGRGADRGPSKEEGSPLAPSELLVEYRLTADPARAHRATRLQLRATFPDPVRALDDPDLAFPAWFPASLLASGSAFFMRLAIGRHLRRLRRAIHREAARSPFGGS